MIGKTYLTINNFLFNLFEVYDYANSYTAYMYFNTFLNQIIKKKHLARCIDGI